MSRKLVLAIVQDQDASRVVDALVQDNLGATRINTHGGFLKRGNATLLVGVDEEEVDRVIQIIDENCQARESAEEGVTVSAGTVFVLGVSEFLRL
jgi:uncharacterized protein YaaQ